MKFNYLLLGAMVCAGFAACSGDEGGNNKKSDVVVEGGTYYMGTRLSVPSGAFSRATAGDYGQGTADESEVAKVQFLFYDADGNFMTVGESGTPTVTMKGDGQNVGAIAEAVIALTLKQGDDYPAYLVAYANVDDSAIDAMQGKSMTEAYAEAASDYKNADGKFLMASSVYLNAAGKATYAVPVTANNFFATTAMAKQPGNALDVYVERLAAKVEVVSASATTPDVEIGDDKLALTIKGWTLSATNGKASYLKQVDESWNAWSTAGWTGWNKPGDHRCFWAKDANYENNTGLTYAGYTTENPTSLYCLENTFSAAAYANADNAENAGDGVATHVVICGQYKLNNEPEGTTFYLNNGLLYKADGLITRWANNGQVYTAATGADGTTYNTLAPGNYKLVRVAGTNHTTLAVDEDKVAAGETLYYKEGNDFVAYADRAAVNAKLLATVGSAITYTEGKVYFTVPVQHFGPAGKDGELGIVRNHWYKVTINKIEGLGTGVYDPDEVVVPGGDDEEKTYHVGARLNVLSWQAINQSVDL
ncbi:MAG: Mfa1 fimbrilin C-terminal domain-containing protein [Rikenellaceae bacterium]|nr:Mfa1 fimbrilin C-terminal domain-containing protein [Rikenellaceae bacterium]